MFKLTFLKQIKFNHKYDSKSFMSLYTGGFRNFSTTRSPKIDYYQVLDLKKNATEEEIKKAYRNLGN